MLEMNSTDGLGGGSITQIVKRFNAETFTYFVGFATLSREWKRGILCVGEKENERKRKTWDTGGGNYTSARMDLLPAASHVRFSRLVLTLFYRYSKPALIKIISTAKYDN